MRKKLLSVLLAALMVCSVIPMSLVQTFAAENTDSAVSDGEEYPALTLGESVAVSIDVAGATATFKFVPGESRDYMLYSTGDLDTYGTLSDSGFNEIVYNDDDGVGNNFCIKRYLEANKTYYIEARLYSSENTGQFNLCVEEYEKGGEYPALELGSETDASFTNGEYDLTYVVTPAETGIYRFYTDSDYAINSAMYASDDTIIAESEDTGDGISLTVALVAGKKYYLNVFIYGYDHDENTGDIDFKIYSEKLETEQIYNGGKATAVISEPKGSVYLMFVPETTDYYAFYSTGGRDTKGFLYDSQLNEISYNDDGGSGNNFRITYELEAGRVYYLKACFYDSEITGQFSVFIENALYVSGMELITPPDNTTVIKGFEHYYSDYTGLSLKVYWSDGTDEVWTYGEDSYIGDEEISYRYHYNDEDDDTDDELVVYCGDQTVSVPVTVIDNPVDRIEITSTSEASVTVNTCGYWNTDNYGERFFYYDLQQIFGDVTACVYYKNGKTESVVWGNKLNGYSFSNNRSQYDDPYTVGENKIKVSYLGAEAELTLTVTESPVESLELVTPSNLAIFENTNGYITDRYDDESGTRVDFYYYNLYDYMLDDAVVKINYKDGKSVTANLGDEIEGATVSFFTNQYEKPWTVGENTYTISYMGAEVEDTVTIMKNPVRSVEFLDRDSVSVVEGTNGYRDDKYNPQTGEYDIEYFRYYTSAFEDLEVLITFNDGSTAIAHPYDSVRDEEIYLQDTQYKNPWTVGGENYLTLGYMGVETEVPVIVAPSPVTEFTLVKPTSRKLIENGDGFWYKEYNPETDEYDHEFFRYEIPEEELSDAEFTITFDDGTSETAHIGDMVRGSRVTCSFEDQEDWTVGNSNYLTVEYTNKTLEMPIEIIENPVESITVDSVPSRVYIYGDDVYGGSEYFRASDYTGLKFTVNFKNGAHKTYTDKDMDGSNMNVNVIDGHYITVSNYRKQTLGANEVTLKYMGVSATYNVTVVESPVSSLEIVSFPTNLTDYRHYSIDWRGTKIKVTYTNGTTSEFTLGENDLFFDHSEYLGYFMAFEHDGIEGRLGYGYKSDADGLIANVRFGGKSVNKPGMSFLESKNIADVQVEDFTPSCENMLVKITYDDGTKESYRLTNVKERERFMTPDYIKSMYAYTPRGLLTFNVFDQDSPESADNIMYLLGKYIKKDSGEPEKDYILGDTDGDGVVTVSDAYVLQKYLAEFKVDNKKQIVMAGDVNRDGILSVSDVTLIQQYAASMAVPYPIGEKI